MALKQVSAHIGPIDVRKPRVIATSAMMLALIVLFRPTMVAQNPALNLLFQGAALLLFLGLLLDLLVSRRKVSGALLALLLYRMVILLPTIAYEGDVGAWAYYTIVQLSLLLLVESATSKGVWRAQRLLFGLSNVLLLFLAINLASILGGFYVVSEIAEGFLQNSYFLGIRTRISDVFFPALMVGFLADSLGRSRFWPRTLGVVALGAWQFALTGVTTAIVGATVVTACFLVVQMVPSLVRWFNMRTITIGSLLLSGAFVLGRVNESEFVSDLVSETLGKSSTLTGRTEIWEVALPLIGDSLLFGHGVNHSFGAFVPWSFGLLWQAHNQYLQILYDGGILGLAAFILFLWISGVAFDRYDLGRPIRAAVLATYAAFGVMFVSEIYTYNMGMFFLVPFIASRIDYFGFPRSASQDSVGG